MKRLVYALVSYILVTGIAAAQVITGSVPNTFVNGTIIDATQMNADFAYIVSQVNTNGAKNGVNSDITALSALTTPIPFSSGASTNFVAATVGGTANAITVASTVPNISAFALVSGYQVTFRASSTNTAATTLTVGATTTKNIYKQTPSGIAAVTGGEIVAGEYTTVIYDGTQFLLFNDKTQGFGFGYLTAIAGGATVDLSTVPSRSAYVTGTTFTVTSLGSPPAALQQIYYLVTWANSSTVSITAGASIALLDGAGSRVVTAGDRQLWFWDGSVWTEAAFFPAQRRYTPGIANKLIIKNNAGTPNSKIDVSATETVMESSGGGNYYAENYGSCTIDLTTTGAAGLDTGTLAANTWYAIYVISTGSTNSCLASTSTSAPTMPSGYTYKLRVGMTRTASGAATLWAIQQYGKEVTIDTATGTAGDQLVTSTVAGVCSTAGFTLVTTGNIWTTFAPNSSEANALLISIDATGTGAVSGSACINSSNSGTTGYQCAFSYLNGTSLPAGFTTKVQYHGANDLYYCIRTAGNVYIRGWEDRVNAN